MELRLHDSIPYLKDLYTINSKGEIFSDNTGKMKTRNKSNTEYQLINLMCENGRKKTFKVHRLVLMAFCPIDNPEKKEVNHIDGNKKNNCLDNLEWCTSSENQKHAFKTGLQHARRGEQSNFSKLSQEDVDKIFFLRKAGYTQQKIADTVGCTRNNISLILNYKTWSNK